MIINCQVPQYLMSDTGNCKCEDDVVIKSEISSPPHYEASKDFKHEHDAIVKHEGKTSSCSCYSKLECLELKCETKVELLDKTAISNDSHEGGVKLSGDENSSQNGAPEKVPKVKHFKSTKRKSRRLKKGEFLQRCTHCDYTTKNEQEFLKHVDKHEEKIWKCTQCDYETTNKSNFFKFHLKIHQIEKPYKCEKCDFSSITKSRLMSHRRKKHKEKDLICPHCSYKTNYKPHLTAHIRQVHVVDKKFKCSQCDFASAYNCSFKMHMMRHTGEKPHRCKFCDYSTNDRGHLITHLRRHTGDKPHQCSLCDYSTVEKYSLIVHERLHKNERPFHCSECDFASHTKESLRGHFKTKHAPEALKFKCSECEFVTHNSVRLKWHTRTHSGDTIYPCDMCEYVGASKNNLEQHLNRFHSFEKPHCCSKCEFRTAYKESLKRHELGCAKDS